MLDPVRNPLKLADWAVPDTKHSYTLRDTAFYALSVGAGQEAGDVLEHRLIDPQNTCFRALPSMAIVIGYPGFWLGEPEVLAETGVTPGQILHVSQSVDLAGTLPAEGGVTGRTQVVALVDKVLTRGSLLYSERKLFSFSSGHHLATCRQTYFLKGAGGFGSFGTPPVQVLQTFESDPDFTIAFQTRNDQALVYRLNGDYNRLHIDQSVAADAGFSKPILHGMCTAGIAVRIVLKALASKHASLTSFAMKMTSPVLPGDRLAVDVWTDGRFRVRVVERNALVIDCGKTDFAIGALPRVSGSM